MKSRNVTFFAFAFAVCLLVPPASAVAEDVKLEGASFQEVLDKLFGTSSTSGLLADGKHFELHAEGVSLTEEQADRFFVPSPVNTADFVDLITAAEQIKGDLKIKGILADGDAFQLKLSGRQVKAEGLVLTQAEFDALVAALKSIPSLREAKIGAIVDGRLLEAKLENRAGRVKIEDRGLRHDGHKAEVARRDLSPGKKDVRLEVSDRIKNDRPEKIERVEKVEKVERPQRPERIERLERPDIEHGGPGKR